MELSSRTALAPPKLESPILAKHSRQAQRGHHANISDPAAKPRHPAFLRRLGGSVPAQAAEHLDSFDLDTRVLSTTDLAADGVHYHDRALQLNAFAVLTVGHAGGAGSAAPTTLDTATGLLSLPAIQVAGTVYREVSVQLSDYRVVAQGNGGSVSYPVVDSGQTAFYNDRTGIPTPAAGAAFYGEDAQFHNNPASYTLSPDGLTVTDNVTHLQWQRSPDTNGDGALTFSDKLTYAEALAYPAKLNAQRFGGYEDWRLPSVKELYSLINFSGTDLCPTCSSSGATPFIDTRYFRFAYGFTSAGERAIDSQWATASTYVANANLMFGVNFADGRIKGYGTGARNGSAKTFFVICVRGNPDYGQNRLVDNGDGTLSDTATGLMWEKTDSGTGMNWADALALATRRNQAAYLGHSDWRLPSAKELQSILDLSRSPDTTHSAAISPLFVSTAIVNEAGQTDYPWYWSATTHASIADDSEAAYVSFGRALGYMNGAWVDIHGAGAQRSDPKSGSLSSFAFAGHGYYKANAPQGDAVRINNFVRLVRYLH